MQVTFWSPFHGTGSTVSCIAASLQYVFENKERGLLIDMHSGGFGLEEAFFERSKLSRLNERDYGIDSLDRLSVVNPEILESEFKSYTNEVIKSSLDLLVGSRKISQNLFHDCFKGTVTKILKNANACYDVVFADINSNTSEDIVQNVLSFSDVVIVTLQQSESMFSSFITSYLEYIANKDVMIVVGRYDIESKYSKDYLKRAAGFKAPLYSIPINTKLLDAINEHKIIDFFSGINKSYKSENDEIFFLQVSEIADRLKEIYENINNRKNLMKSSELGTKDLSSLRGGRHE